MRFLKTHHLPSNAVGATRTEIAIAPKIIIFYPVFFYHQPSGTKGSPKLLMDGDYGSQYGGVGTRDICHSSKPEGTCGSGSQHGLVSRISQDEVNTSDDYGDECDAIVNAMAVVLMVSSAVG